MKKFVVLLTNENQLKNDWENDDSDFIRDLYSVYNMYIYFFHTCLLTCLKKDTSVLLKVTNTWTS